MGFFVYSDELDLFGSMAAMTNITSRKKIIHVDFDVRLEVSRNSFHALQVSEALEHL